MKRGKGRRTGLIVILITGLLLLPGCWGKREVEQLAPLLAVGFDLGQEPDSFLITAQYARVKKTGGNSAEIMDRTFSVEAKSARDAFDKIAKVTYRTPFIGSLKVILIGESVAKNGGFNDILDFTQRFSEFRRSMYLVLVKGKAQDILNLKLRAGLLPGIAIKNNIEGGDEISSFPTVRLGHYLTIQGRKSTAPIFPVVESVKSGEGIEYSAEGQGEAGEMRIDGAGVMSGDRLGSFLTDQETKGYMWLEDNIINRLIDSADLEENGVRFGGQVIKSSTKYKVKASNEKMELRYEINASVAIDEILGLKKQLSGPEWVELVKESERSFARVIEQECEAAIKKQRELGLDFLGIGRHIEQKNAAYWKTIKDQWQEMIADFPVALDIKVTVHHSGMSSSSATNSAGEGQD
ncbi:Ger(x)C family spore germination protein [Desulfosporosinus youngiae]|uniref:Germination protein, Ger(X)C family n=1 Tax=Desulfosporosinus youngiae DSM 17734 TaxID=768710 RepID=H5XRL7_9FIRM|nr:Ger(x)C family spore germination protein [Desulfosporosinus youngiae]EHQ87276.1 germination protein, Ger(X)C family [Desulfosporosinus youngiae DSM 17734]